MRKVILKKHAVEVVVLKEGKTYYIGHMPWKVSLPDQYSFVEVAQLIRPAPEHCFQYYSMDQPQGGMENLGPYTPDVTGIVKSRATVMIS